jgi:hypothetical protein
MQCSHKTKLRADGQAEVHVSSGEESEAVTKEGRREDGSEDEFVTKRKEPVPKWEAGAGREQGCVGAVLQATKAGNWWFGLV